MNNKTLGAILIMAFVLAICIVLQHIAIFTLGYELTQLNQEKQSLEEVVQRQELVVQEISSPAILRSQKERFDIQLSSKVEWPKPTHDVPLSDTPREKVAIE